MKYLTLILTLILSQHVMADDMQAYLAKTQELVREGKHEEALKRNIWFHNHALEHEPSMYGVRLSFALGNWRALGDKYPPALKAFKEIRDTKTKKLEEGKGDEQLFHDVMALNRTLGEDGKTILLFEIIEKKDPPKAKQCWRMAKDTVFKMKRYDIARKYFKDTAKEFDNVELRYEDGKNLYDDPQVGGEDFKKYNESNLVREALQLIEVSLAIGKRDDALSIQKRALKLVNDDRLRKAIPSKESDE